MNSDTRRLIKALERQGFKVRKTKRHLSVSHPGKPGHAIFSSTPSDHRSWKNSMADLRRITNPTRERT